MQKRFYFDTSIWLDLFEDRNEPNLPKGKFAKELVNKILIQSSIVFYSELRIKELKHLGYTLEEIINKFRFIKNNLRRANINKKDKELSKKIAKKRNLPPGDVLHAILSKDNEAQLISRDYHFEKLKNIIIAKKPEDII